MISFYCKVNHFSDQCKVDPTIEARRKQLQSGSYICLRSDHRSLNCLKEQMCVYCGFKRCHHRSLCPIQISATTKKVSSEFLQMSNEDNLNISKQEPPKAEETISTPHLVAVTEKVIMQTAIANVENPVTHELFSARVMLDSGSQSSYMTTKLMNDLKLKAISSEQLSSLF